MVFMSNTNMADYRGGISVDNPAMELKPIEEIRQQNLKLVLKEYFGSQADLAKEMGVDKNNVSRWLAWPKDNSRLITSESARDIEAAANRRGAGVPVNWMDHEHNCTDQEANQLFQEIAEEDAEALKTVLRAMRKKKH